MLHVEAGLHFGRRRLGREVRRGAPFGDGVSAWVRHIREIRPTGCASCGGMFHAPVLGRLRVCHPWSLRRHAVELLHRMLGTSAWIARQGCTAGNEGAGLRVEVRSNIVVAWHQRRPGVLECGVKMLSRVLRIWISRHVGTHRLRRVVGPMNRRLVSLRWLLVISRVRR